jgi:hypothetical protein
MTDSKPIRIAGVKPVRDHTLKVIFTNRKAFTVNLSDFVHRLKGLRPLRDPGMFMQVALGEGGFSLVWPGDRDVGADRIYEMALEQNGRTDAAAFIRWRWRNRLSLTAAAGALGVSRRMVAYYTSGEHEVPRTILLACKGWEAERRHADTSA